MNRTRIEQIMRYMALVMYDITIVSCIFNNTTLNGSAMFEPIFNVGIKIRRNMNDSETIKSFGDFTGSLEC